VEFSKIGIVGAGTMGRQLAHLIVRGTEASVRLHDTEPEALARAERYHAKELQKLAKRGKIGKIEIETMMGRFSVTDKLSDLCGSDFVLTAMVEDLDVKRRVFRQLDKCVGPEVVLATCTSALSVTALAAAVEESHRVIGLHFFNPPQLIRLVEVVRGVETSDEVFDRACRFCHDLGKETIVSKDTPGFATSRLAAVLINEAICELYEGVASGEDIDRGMKLGYNMPMGPLALADLIGLDVMLSILETLQTNYGDPKYRPCILLRKKVESGQLGRKTGSGFFEYA
jgi:3-hydroxybutyryl-CoA dehydrogenase